MLKTNAVQLPRLYPILDTASLARRGCAAETFAGAVLEAGAKILQFRCKEAFNRQIFEQARRIGLQCSSAGAMYVVNDRSDIAAMLGAGVHLGQDDLPPERVRPWLGPDAVIGFSTHNEQQLRQGDSLAVDYLAIGPVFATGSKERPDPTLGLEEVARLRALTTKPLVAIGGVTLENAAGVLGAGADSIALISGLIPEDCTKQSIRALTEQWLLNLER